MRNERRSDQVGAGDVAGRRRDPEAARAATVRVIERHGAQVMRTAQRYAASQEDAEDAYQRGIEIMLTKAPDIPDAELLPWLKTVVRHEAFALRRKEGRAAQGTLNGDVGVEESMVSLAPTPSEQAERFERLRLAAEAMSGLKPQEARALALLAQGYSYSQICEKTGWTYTKVNRCLAEGRQRFVKRLAGLESGAECERLGPKLSAFADGEAPAADVAVLRRHLRGCRACQVSLREQALAPALVGALLPPTMFVHLAWLMERLGDLTSLCKVKLVSAHRLLSLDAGHLSVTGGSRGIASTGLAKALTAVCIGGAGAGGAAVIEQALDSKGPEPAQASAREPAPAVPRVKLATRPSPRLAAKRLTDADDESRSTSQGPEAMEPTEGAKRSGLSKAVTDKRPSVRGGREPRNSSAEAAAPTNHDSERSHGERTTRSPQGATDGRSSQDSSQEDDLYGDGIPENDPYGNGAQPDDHYYGCGISPDNSHSDRAEPDDPYGCGIPPDDRYGGGAEPETANRRGTAREETDGAE